MVEQPIRVIFLALAGLYAVVIVWVWAGVFYYSGVTYMHLMPILAFSFIISFGLIYFLAIPHAQFAEKFELNINIDIVCNFAICVIILLILTTWIVLGGIPTIEAYRVSDAMEAALIRESIGDVTIPLFGYIPTVVTTSIAFFIIFFIATGRQLRSWVVVFLGFSYGVSLMPKSYPLFMLIPPAVYCVLTMRLTRGATLLAFAVMAVVIELLAANPSLRPSFLAHFERSQAAISNDHSIVGRAERATPKNDDSSVYPAPVPEAAPTEAAKTKSPDFSFSEKIRRSFRGVVSRVLYAPGNVVSKWFETFPKDISYENGCGYRFIAPFIGCEFQANALVLYKHYYPDYVAKGFLGSLNAAHFAEEYANFGPIGLVFSGFLIALVLAVAAIASARAGLAAAISINFPFIMAIGSTALHTTLLSGGWGLMLALTVLFFSSRKRSDPLHVVD